jgi:hypothetical protein
LISILLIKQVPVSKETASDYIVVEGWMSKDYLETAYRLMKELHPKKVFITGGTYPVNTITDSKSQWVRSDKFTDLRIAANGGCVGIFKSIPATRDTTKISVRASGSESRGYMAHFNLVVNDSLIKGFFTRPYDSVYQIKFGTGEIRSVTLDFNNDVYCPGYSDRNLTIHQILINNIPIENIDCELYRVNFSGVNNYPRGVCSESEEAKMYLEQLGYNKNTIVPVDAPFVQKNKTLANAKALSKYLSENYPDIGSMNILTQEDHSWRSYLNYKNALKHDDIKVGIIPLTVNSENCVKQEDQQWEKFKARINESLSLLYTYWYWIWH